MTASASHRTIDAGSAAGAGLLRILCPVLLAMLILIFNTGSLNAAAAWYNSNWGYRSRITIDNTKVDETITDYPVYIDLANMPSAFHTHINQTDARDIRVTKADGITEVPREVVSYNSTTDTGELYFKGDVDNSSDTEFFIYYGNVMAAEPAASATFGSQNVWNSNYVAVYHLSTGTTDETDSTANAYTLTENGTVDLTTSGKIGSARERATVGSTNYLTHADATDLDNIGAMTVQIWFRSTTATPSSAVRGIASKRVNVSSQHSWGLFLYTSDKLNWDNGNATGVNFDTRTVSSATIAANTWYLLHAVFDGSLVSTSRKKLYLQGAIDVTGAANVTSIPNTTSNMSLFILAGNTGALQGQIDEFRFSKAAFSSTRVSTEYNNLNAPSTFVKTWGGEERNPMGNFLTFF